MLLCSASDDRPGLFLPSQHSTAAIMKRIYALTTPSFNPPIRIRLAESAAWENLPDVHRLILHTWYTPGTQFTTQTPHTISRNEQCVPASILPCR